MADLVEQRIVPRSVGDWVKFDPPIELKGPGSIEVLTIAPKHEMSLVLVREADSDAL